MSTTKPEVIHYKGYRISVFNVAQKAGLWHFETKITTPIDAPYVETQPQIGECSCNSAEQTIKFAMRKAVEYIENHYL